MITVPDRTRRPGEEFPEFLARLEAERIRSVGEVKEKEAEALEQVAESQHDNVLHIAARAKKISADEWMTAWQEHPGSQTDSDQ